MTIKVRSFGNFLESFKKCPFNIVLWPQFKKLNNLRKRFMICVCKLLLKSYSMYVLCLRKQCYGFIQTNIYWVLGFPINGSRFMLFASNQFLVYYNYVSNIGLFNAQNLVWLNSFIQCLLCFKYWTINGSLKSVKIARSTLSRVERNCYLILFIQYFKHHFIEFWKIILYIVFSKLLIFFLYCQKQPRMCVFQWKHQ